MYYKPFFQHQKVFFLDKQLESYIVQYGNIIFFFIFKADNFI